jgi:ubiquitin-like 1-activating enzyme E1 B
MEAEEEALKKELEVSYERWLFRKLFHRDILKRLRVAELSNEEIWKGKQPPKAIFPAEASSIQLAETSSHTGLADQRIWSLEESILRFYQSAAKLRTRFLASGAVEWDKDDEDALEFVTSATNLRSYNFHIPLQSKFDTKAMAGNIIPAIATTNAIIAGLIVLEAFKNLNNQQDKCKYTYLLRRPSGKRVLMDVALEKPNPNVGDQIMNIQHCNFTLLTILECCVGFLVLYLFLKSNSIAD